MDPRVVAETHPLVDPLPQTLGVGKRLAVDESTNKTLKAEFVHREEVLDAARAAGEVERLRPPVQQFQDAFDSRLHEPGRVQIGGPDSLENLFRLG